jgi:hypothetical protein
MMPFGASAGQSQCDNLRRMGEEMYGIVSVLDEEHQVAVWELWADIEREFGVRISDTHVPHFSYHVAKAYSTAVHETLATVAVSMAPVRTSSFFIGVFNAPPPLFFLPLVRTDALSALHRRLWSELVPVATEVMDRYAAKRWFATVNLAPDLERDVSRELMPFLLARDLAWEIMVDNVCLLHDTGERQLLEARFELSG